MNGNGSLSSCFFLGALVGAAVALLYAPRSGKETRQYLAKKTKKLKDNAENVYQETKDTARSFMNEASDLTRSRA